MNKGYKIISKHNLIGLVLILMLVLAISGCKKDEPVVMTFNYEGITNMEIRDGNTGEAIILNVEQTDYVWNNIKCIQFIQGESSIDYGGWMYNLELFQASQSIGRITILDEYTIDYNDYFYTDETASIDIAYIQNLFQEDSQSTEVIIDETLDNETNEQVDTEIDDTLENDDSEVVIDNDDSLDEASIIIAISELENQIQELEQDKIDLENIIEEQDIVINQLEAKPTTEYIIEDTAVVRNMDGHMDDVIDVLMDSGAIPVYNYGGFSDEQGVFDKITTWYSAYQSSKEKVLIACDSPYNSGGQVFVDVIEFRSLPPNVDPNDLANYAPIVSVQFRMSSNGSQWVIDTYIDQF